MGRYLACRRCGRAAAFSMENGRAIWVDWTVCDCHAPVGRLHGRTAVLWRRIEAEFGEPVEDVIRGMREQGCTWRTVGSALEISPPTLLDWRRRLGMAVDGAKVWDDYSRETLRQRMPSPCG